MTIFLINILKVYLYSHQISAGSRWFYRNGRKHYYLCWCHRDVDSMRRPNYFLVVQVVKTHPGFLLALNYFKKKNLSRHSSTRFQRKSIITGWFINVKVSVHTLNLVPLTGFVNVKLILREEKVIRDRRKYILHLHKNTHDLQLIWVKIIAITYVSKLYIFTIQYFMIP